LDGSLFIIFKAHLSSLDPLIDTLDFSIVFIEIHLGERLILDRSIKPHAPLCNSGFVPDPLPKHHIGHGLSIETSKLIAGF